MDWYEDAFESNYEGDLQELVETVNEGNRYGIRPRGAYTQALAQQQLGKGEHFGPDDNGAEKELVRLQMPQEFSRDWTVTWNVVFERVEVRAGVFARARAEVGNSFLEIRWGSGGAQNFVQVDVRQGGCLTVFGNFVEVVAVGEDIIGPPLQENPGGVISATIAPGAPSGGRNQATKTVVLGNIAPEVTVTSAVPPRALYVMHYISAPDSDFDRTLAFRGGLTGSVGSYFYVNQDELGNPAYGPALLVPAGARLLDFRNEEPPLGATFLSVSLIYTLAL